MNMTAFDEYVRHGISSVEGWAYGDQLNFIRYGSEIQNNINISGGVTEIGVHHGRFFIAMMLLRKPTEIALAVDVFDS